MTAGFWIVLISTAVYGLLHSLLASRTAKMLAERWFGRKSRRMYRLGFSVMAVVTLIPILALAALLPDERIYAIPFPFTLLSGLLQLAGAAGVVYGVMQTGAMRFVGLDLALDAEAVRQPVPFITRGLYRWVRHPLYTCSLAVLWLMPVMSWNLLALNLGVTAYFIIGARYEEDKLIDEFGQAYIDYRHKTPAFLPRLDRLG